jgi:hypothetical protein
MEFRSRRLMVSRAGADIVRAVVVAGLVASALAGCSGTTEPAGIVRIKPASPTVSLKATPQGRSLITSVRLTNTSPYPVYWYYCSLSLQRKASVVALSSASDAAWATVWSPLCVTLGAYAISILAPGQSVTVPINAPVSQGTPPTSFDGALGIYRVHMYLSSQVAGENRPIPEELSSSDPFSLVAQ